MVNKSSFLLPFLVFLSFITVACVTKTIPSPTADQNAIGTIIAATLEATSTATHAIQSKNPPSTLVTPSAPPVTPEPSSNPLPSPTSTNLTDLAVRIAYIKNGDVFLWNEGVITRDLTDTHDAIDLHISGDGNLIAFKRQDPNDLLSQEIWMVNTNGTPNSAVLISESDLAELKAPDPNANILGYGVLDFTWRPNSHDLAYNTLVLHEGPGFGPNYDLRLVNADTLAKSTLFDTSQGGIFYYSPDGNQIALSNPDSISLLNANGQNMRKNVLTFPIVGTYSEYYYTPHPIWSADNHSLRVAIPPEETLAIPIQPTGLWFIPVDGSSAILLSNIQAMPFAWPDNAFAPDLEYVIYVKPVGDQTENQRELHIASPDGSSDLVYDSGESLEFMSWSPDAQHFIYQINSGARKGIYTGGFNDQRLLIAPDPHSMRDIQWLDGTQFAYLIQSGSQWELHISNLNGDELAYIDTLPDSSPVFDVYP